MSISSPPASPPELPLKYDPECPVCGNIVAGNMEDVAEHVEECLAGGRENSEEEHEDQVTERIEVPDEMPVSAFINVEGEESRYGKAQYTFADMKRLASLPDPPDPTNNLPLDPSCPRSDLLQRIREQEEQLSRSPHCLICLDAYRSPVVSVGCWHVCCEGCWGRVLVAKRLCPQCSRITAPEDLRRIYL